MGFSTSGAIAVIFIAILLSLGVLVPSVDGAYERVAHAADEEDERALAVTNTAIQIVATDYKPGQDELTVEVDNEGSRTIDVEHTTLLVDGVYVTPDNTTVDGEAGRTVWAPGERLTFTVQGYTSDPNRVKVVTGNGVADTETGV